MKERILTNIHSREDAREWISENLAAVRALYIDKDLTARETMRIVGLGRWYEDHPRYFGRYLNHHLPKGKQHGGKRRGAGNKKGIRFCGECRQVLPDNCT